MRIAEYIDTHGRREELRAWFLEKREEVLDILSQEEGRVAKEREGNVELRWVWLGEGKGSHGGHAWWRGRSVAAKMAVGRSIDLRCVVRRGSGRSVEPMWVWLGKGGAKMTRSNVVPRWV